LCARLSWLLVSF